MGGWMFELKLISKIEASNAKDLLEITLLNYLKTGSSIGIMLALKG
jgi:hypothetical protein